MFVLGVTLILVSLSFTEILLFGTPALAAVFVYFLLKRGEGEGLHVSKGYDTIRYVHYSLLLALSLTTVYSVYADSRPFIYFLIISALFVTSVLIGMNPNKKSSQGILFLTAIILAVSVPTAIIVGNNFYPFNSFGSESILQTGNIQAYQSSAMAAGDYYYIPIETLLECSVALVTGQAIIAPFVYVVAFLVAAVAGIFILLRRLSHSALTGIIGVFFLMSIPSLTILGRMPAIVYVIFYILFMLMIFESHHASVICLWIVSLPMIFMHPSGLVAVIALLLPLAILGIKNWPGKGMNSRRMRLSILTTVIIALAYWSYTYLLSFMSNVGIKFYSTIQSYFSGVTVSGIGSNYAPLYYSPGYEVYAYAWAIPAALAATLLISVIFQLIRKKKPEPSQSLIITSAFTGLVIVIIAYLSYS